MLLHVFFQDGTIITLEVLVLKLHMYLQRLGGVSFVVTVFTFDQLRLLSLLRWLHHRPHQISWLRYHVL